MPRKILALTDDYEVYMIGGVYVVSFYDEQITHDKYNRNKQDKQSRITQNRQYIEKFFIV